MLGMCGYGRKPHCLFPFHGHIFGYHEQCSHNRSNPKPSMLRTGKVQGLDMKFASTVGFRLGRVWRLGKDYIEQVFWVAFDS